MSRPAPPAVGSCTVMTRMAMYLQDAHTIREGMELVRYAEQRGFEAVWHPVLALTDPLPMAIFPTMVVALPLPVSMHPEHVRCGLHGDNLDARRRRRCVGNDDHARAGVFNARWSDGACRARGQDGQGRHPASGTRVHHVLTFQ